MTRIGQLFAQKKKDIVSVYFTAGYPTLHSTREIIEALQQQGADMIEIGMPYSDPLADGPVIQQSSAIALQQGMSIALLLEQLKDFRQQIHIPVVLMGYLNPVLQFGFEKFCNQAAELGIDGLIIPDLPSFEFSTIYQPVLQKAGLDFIFLVTPETSPERIKKLDALSTGFLYAVSSSSTTGQDKDFNAVIQYLERLQSYSLQNPVVVGFGIKDRNSLTAVQPYTQGAIIGSAFITALQGEHSPAQATQLFMARVRPVQG
jgi:tryptophan synthase alpha chain